jgi:hypothetical protein
LSDLLFFDQEPVVGWRAWAAVETVEGPELQSVVYPHPWPARRALRNVCEAGGCLAARWPAQPHSCGIHAFKAREDALAFPSTWESLRFAHGVYPEHYVIGRVSLWGRVVEHERGYRAEVAYPSALELLLPQEWLVLPLAARYGIDVVIS